jgi:hypothetical protein
MLRLSSFRAWSVLGTGAALAAATQLLVGQQPGGGPGATGTLTGTVYDSTAAAPLSGASVLLTHATRGDVPSLNIVADSSGRFAAHDLAPGRWIVAFLHRVTEEYGVAAVPREITIAGGDSGDVVLSLPRARTLREAVCGDVAAQDSAGVLVGSVRDEDTGEWVAGATVTAEWRIMQISNGVKMTTRSAPAVTAPDGTFRLCGLPTEDALTLRAVRPLPAGTSEALSSGEIFVTLPTAGIARAHIGVGRLPMATVSALYAPPPTMSGVPRVPPRVSGRAQLEGVVSDPNGRPLPGARILVLGTGRGALTGDNGTFRFDSLPSGSWTVETRALGYTPLRTPVLLGATPATLRLGFAKWVPALDRVVVYGKMSAKDRFLADFLERQARGVGTFFTEADVERYKPNQLTELLLRVPGVRLSPSRRPGDPARVSGRGGCEVDVFVNGNRVAEGGNEFDWLMRPADVLAIEVHDPINGTPGAFGSSTACLVIGLWTKR